MRRLIRILAVFLLLALLMTAANAADTYIASMDVNVVVDRYGNAETTVTVEVHFDSETDSVQLPVGTNVSRISASGGSFSKKTSDGVTWLVLRHAEGTQGVHTYVISYRQTGVVTINSDKTEQLDLELLCPYWSWRIEKLTYSVTLPKELSSSITYVSGYYGDGITVRDSRTGTTVSGQVLSSMMDQESIHMQADLPAGFCTILHRQGTLSTVTGVLMIGILIALAAYWLLQLANPIPGIENRKVPPDGVGAWEFPYVLSCGRPDLSLLIFEWANLGYLTIHVSERGRVTLHKRMEMSSERRAHELKIFTLLFESGNTAAADSTAFRRLADRASAASSEYWNPRLFRQNSGNPEFLHLGAALLMGISWMRCADWLFPAWSLRILLIIPMLALGFAAGYIMQQSLQALLRKEKRNPLPGLIALVLSFLFVNNEGGAALPMLAILAQLLSAMLTYRGGRRSETGMTAIAQIRSFRRELTSITPHQLQLQLGNDPQYYYRILPFAEILGLGSRFSATFENMRLDRCPWYENGHNQYLTASEFYEAFSDTLQRMRKGRRTLRSRIKRRG